jgi:hypothetical protein
MGEGLGECSLELMLRNGRKQTFVVRVVQPQDRLVRVVRNSESQAPVANRSSAIAPTSKNGLESGFETGVAKPNLTKSQNIATEERNTNETANAIKETAVAVVSSPQAPYSPAAVTVTKPAIDSGKAKESVLDRLEFSTGSMFFMDAERLRLITVDSLGLNGRIDGDSNSEETDREITIRRTAHVTPFLLSFDFNRANSLSVSVPYIRREDRINIDQQVITTRATGFGDVHLRFDRRYNGILKSAWNSLVQIDIGLPTGKSVYNTNANESPTGIGHFEVGGNVSFERAFDPVTFHTTLGISRFLPKKVNDVSIDPGFGYLMQTGFGFALTDRLAFLEQLEYARRPDVFLTSPLDFKTVSSAQSSVGHSFLYRPRGGHEFQMFFNLGLTPQSPDYGIGISYSFRRKPQRRE